MTTSFEELAVGDVVELSHHGRDVVGVVRFAGKTEFVDVALVGVELRFPSGSCDGDRKGKQYFEKEQSLTKSGIFLSAKTAGESNLKRVGNLDDDSDGHSEDARNAIEQFPSTWNDGRGSNPNQFVLKLLHSKFPLVEEVAISRGWCVSTDVAESNWQLCWSDNIEVLQQGLLPGISETQKINHWPLTNNLAVKALLADKLKKMRSGGHEKDYDFFPMTWTVPKEIKSVRALAAANKRDGKHPIYIVKPPGAAEGRGIYLVHDLHSWLTENFPPKSGGASKPKSGSKRQSLIVQEYLGRPLLVDGFKFDLRVYVLVSSMDPLRIYVYSDGLARFCTSKYVAPCESNIEDLKMHLTNYAVNVGGENFDSNTADDVGSKRTLQAILTWMKCNGHDAGAFLDRMDAAIIKTVIAVQRLSTAAYRKVSSYLFLSLVWQPFELVASLRRLIPDSETAHQNQVILATKTRLLHVLR